MRLLVFTLPFGVIAMTIACTDSDPSTRNAALPSMPANEEPSGYVEPEGLLEPGIGACNYVNPFSKLNECKQYSGADWTDDSALENCGSVFAGTAGDYTSGAKCQVFPNSGACVVTVDPGEEYYILQEGTAELCSTLKGACENFAQGTFLATPGGVCDGGETVAGGLGPDGGELQPEGLAAMTSTDLVTVDPECVDAECITELADSGQYITFTPTGDVSNVGAIFYPGGNLDPRSYATATQAFAEAGFTSFLVPMPGDLAFNGLNRAADIIDARPDIEKWVLVGHSLGGVVGVKFASRNPDALSGIALWATFMDVGDDISDLALPATSIYGDLDPLAPIEDVLQDEAKMPAETTFVRIRGGNHSHFMWHGMKEGDVRSELISQSQQAELAAQSTIHLLKRVELQASFGLDPAFETAARLDQELGCGEVQRVVGNFVEAGLPMERINTIHRDAFRTFWAYSESAAYTTPDEDQWVHVYQYDKQVANPSNVHAPPILSGELFCKLRSQEAIVQSVFGEDPPVAGPQNVCGAYNEHVMSWAFTQLSIEGTDASNQWNISIEEDTLYTAAPDFMTDEDSLVTIDLDASNRTVTMRSSAFVAPEDLDEDEAGAGAVYCKVLSYQSALLHAQELIATSR